MSIMIMVINIGHDYAVYTHIFINEKLLWSEFGFTPTPSPIGIAILVKAMLMHINTTFQIWLSFSSGKVYTLSLYIYTKVITKNNGNKYH